MENPLLEIRDLQTWFFTGASPVKSVDGIHLSLHRGETLGIVGESGSGKSVTAMSIMRLISHPGKIIGGEILFEGKNLLTLSENEMRHIRGNDISMVFQDPMTALNPVFTIGEQIAEAIRLHQDTSKAAAWQKAIDMLRIVGIPEPAERSKQYPHEFSGGMRQRAMIAMALACQPKLLIADEPTTALDVTVQAQILRLMKELQDEFQTAIILITHDLGVVAETCDYVAVMYGGNCVEYTDVHTLFAAPSHPYTWGLLNAQPSLHGDKKQSLIPIEGNPPDLANLGPGCAFAPRCAYQAERCLAEKPALRVLADGHEVACHYSEELLAKRQKEVRDHD